MMGQIGSLEDKIKSSADAVRDEHRADIQRLEKRQIDESKDVDDKLTAMREEYRIESQSLRILVETLTRHQKDVSNE